MNPPPLISIIMPAYNCENYIAASIESALSQTYQNFELIIIDDCSKDDTFDIVEEYRKNDSRIVSLKNKKNMGVAFTRNLGFAQSHGEYIALLDADDIWLPEKLALQLSYLTANQLDLCYTAYAFLSADGNAIDKPYYVPGQVDFRFMLRENVIGCSTVLMKSSLTKCVQMRPDYAHEDYAFWLELLQLGYKAGGLNQVLMKYRLAPCGRSANKRKAALNRWKIYRRLLKLNIFQSISAFIPYAVRAFKKHGLYVIYGKRGLL